MKTTREPIAPGATRQVIEREQADEAYGLQAFEAFEAWLAQRCEAKGGPVTITKREQAQIEAAVAAATGDDPDGLIWPQSYRRTFEHRDYGRSGCRNGWAITLSRFDEKGCPCLDVATLRELNTPHVAARDKRQSAREAALAGDLPERIDAAAQLAKDALLEFGRLVKQADADWTAIERALGLEGIR